MRRYLALAHAAIEGQMHGLLLRFGQLSDCLFLDLGMVVSSDFLIRPRETILALGGRFLRNRSRGARHRQLDDGRSRYCGAGRR